MMNVYDFLDGLGDKECLASMSDWCHFVRAVFHKETAKQDFEANMPSMAALDRHKRRAEYIYTWLIRHLLVLAHNCLVFTHMAG
jgi:hypothetical protein